MKCAVELGEDLPFLDVFVLSSFHGVEVLLLGYLLAECLGELVVDGFELALPALQLETEGVVFAAYVAYEFALLEHGVAVEGVMGGSAYCAGFAFA